MRRVTVRTGRAFLLLSTLSMASQAHATADVDSVVLVHQETDGSLWYDWYETPANRTFLTAKHPCWVDHDHIRLGTRNRDDCLSSRP